MSKAPRISSAALKRLGRTIAERPVKVTATRPGRAQKPLRTSGGQSFDVWCAQLGLPVPIAEHRFHPIRRWRFDWCWIDERIAVEQEGGVWSQGRHTRGKGFLADMHKYNSAAALGWRLFRFSPQQIASGEATRFLVEHWARLTNNGA
jgi:hypothetical protein